MPSQSLDAPSGSASRPAHRTPGIPVHCPRPALVGPEREGGDAAQVLLVERVAAPLDAGQVQDRLLDVGGEAEDGVGSGPRGAGGPGSLRRQPVSISVPEEVEVLARTPSALDALLRRLPAPWLTADEGPGTCSPWDVVGHLIHGERTDWIPRVRMILEKCESEPFVPFDREGHREMFRGMATEDLLELFRAERARSLDSLRARKLRGADLARTGCHPALGTVTLQMLIATWVVHDLGHVRQVCRVMAGWYRDEVGPWEEYLPVLAERRSR